MNITELFVSHSLTFPIETGFLLSFCTWRTQTLKNLVFCSYSANTIKSNLSIVCIVCMVAEKAEKLACL